MIKLFEKRKINKEREIKLINIPILSYGERTKDGVIERYIDLFPKSMDSDFLETVSEVLNSDCDLVIVPRTISLGETYLLIYLIDEICRNNSSKKPCILLRNKMLEEVLNAFGVNIPILYNNNLDWKRFHLLQNRFCKSKNTKFYIYPCKLQESQSLYKAYREDNKKAVNLVKQIMSWNYCSGFKDVKLKFNESDIEFVNQFIKKKDLKNFIFFVPEASTVEGLSVEFWRMLSLAFYRKGYKVYSNTKNGNCDYAISERLSLVQALYLANLSKGIVSLRCGFLEILSSLDKTKVVLYTNQKFENVTSKNMKKYTSLVYYPNVSEDKLYEYDTVEYTQDDLINMIVNSILYNEERITK